MRTFVITHKRRQTNQIIVKFIASSTSKEIRKQYKWLNAVYLESILEANVILLRADSALILPRVIDFNPEVFVSMWQGQKRYYIQIVPTIIMKSQLN